MAEEMIIQCEKCSSRYTLDPGLVKGDRAKVRCSRCGHVFTVKKPVERVEAEDVLGFGEPGLGLGEEPSLEEEPAVEIAPPRPRPMREPSPRRSPVVYAALFVVATALAFFAFYYLKGQGPSFKPSPGDKGADLLNLLGINAYFVENRDAGTLFVVSGRLRNEYPVLRRKVRLRLRIYTEDSKVAMEKEFLAGGSISKQEAGKLSFKELEKRTANAGTGPQGAVMPRQTIPFAVVVKSLPPIGKLGDYSVDLIGSSA